MTFLKHLANISIIHLFYCLQTAPLVSDILLQTSTAYRAILAEPRTKTSPTENEYFGNSRSEHVANESGMGGYPFSGTVYLSICHHLFMTSLFHSYVST